MKNAIIRAAGVLLAASMIFGGAAATASAAEATSPSTGTTSSTQAAESINREWVLNPANNTELAALGTIQGGSQTFDGLTIERVDINYTVGGAGRSKTRSGELIIRNW